MTHASDFLRRLLADGPVSAADGERQGRQAGVSSRSLDRARREIGAVAERAAGHWQWSLPANAGKDATTPAAIIAKDAKPAQPSPPPPRRIEDLRPGDLVEWNGRTWPLLGFGNRDGVPLAYFTNPEAVGGIGCQPVWSVRVPKDAKG